MFLYAPPRQTVCTPNPYILCEREQTVPKKARVGGKKADQKKNDPNQTKSDVKSNSAPVGLNKFDLIEKSVENVVNLVTKHGLTVKPDTLATMRLKLLEVAFRNGKMEVKGDDGNSTSILEGGRGSSDM